jgi:signal transduction histidine kinase
VQEHGGRIECFNRPEGGATFLVEFPVNALDTYLNDSPLATSSHSN